MKKIILSLFVLILAGKNLNGQCSSSSASSFMNCGSYYDYIYQFSLNSIASNNAGCSTNGYGLFSTPVRTLTMGNTYAWTASTGWFYANGMGIWIDWNNDGQFTATENVAARNYAYSHSGNITVPYTAAIGVNLKMRVRCAEYYTFSSTTSPCNGLNGYGETEDYFVYISCPASLPTLTVAATSTYICAGQSVTLTANGAQSYTWTGATAVTNGVGFSPTTTGAYTVTGGIAACPSVTSTAVRTISVTNVPLPVNIGTSTTTICNGKTATLTATGASNYTWMPGGLTQSLVIVSPSANQTYTLTGYNGTGCPGSTTVALSVDPQPTLAIVASAATVCSGAPVTLTVSGALTYSWIQGGSTSTVVTFNPTQSSAYAVIGYNSFGCPGSTSQIVLTTQSPTVTAATNPIGICAGGVASIAGGGANTYSLNGSPVTGSSFTVNPTTTTVYTVTGKNNNTGCTNSKTVTVNVSTPSLTVSNSATICNGAEVVLNAGGATSYVWSTGGSANTISVTPNVTTLYVVTATTNINGLKCVSSASANVTVNSNPTITAVATRTSICRFETTSITASGATSYSWSNSTSTTSVLSLTPTTASAVFINITGYDQKNCSSTTSLLLKVNSCTAINEVSAGSNMVKVFPNPSTGIIMIQAAADMDLRLVTELGQEVQHVRLTGMNDHKLVVEGLADGIYFLVGTSGASEINQKIIVTK